MAALADAFAALAQLDVPALVIGGHALQAYGLSRPTFDVDCLIASSNKEGLRSALVRFNFLWMAEFDAFTEYRHRGRMDSIPVHVMHVDVGTFEKFWAESFEHLFEGTRLRVPALAHLVALKLHAAKNQQERAGKDMRDVIQLLQFNVGVVSKEDLRKLCQRYASAEAIRQLEALQLL